MTARVASHSQFSERPALSAVVLRTLIVLSPLAAVGVTWVAAERTVPVVAALVGLLAVAGAALPNSHVGVLIVATIAVQWVAIVDRHTTPWSIAAAATLIIFHAAQAASTVAPSTTAWTSAMRRRWTRRTVLLVGASAGTWALVTFFDARQFGANTILLTASLLALAAGALWARNGTPS